MILTKEMKKIDAGLAKKPASAYTDCNGNTAKVKAQTARDWELFLIRRLFMDPSKLQGTDYGSKFDGFPKSVYHHLNQYCGYIAHYDQHGFFANQFEQTEDFVNNVGAFAQGRDQYGTPLVRGSWGIKINFDDLHKVMIEVAKHYLPKAQALLQLERTTAHKEKVQAARELLEREGMKVA